MNHWHLTKEEDIFWLIFDHKEAEINTLNRAVLTELDEILEKLAVSPFPRALVIRSGKKSGFIAGADITQFKTLSPEEAKALIQQGQAVFNKLEMLPFLTIALIEGFCLGGGLELALACQYRIAKEDLRTRLGLPEVKLGILPGWGGIQRLCKLIGPKKAMEMILTGKILSVHQAKKWGVIQEVVPERLLEKAIKDVAFSSPSPPKAKRQPKILRECFAWFLNKKLRQKIDPLHYPAPFKIVENWAKYGVSAHSMQADVTAFETLLCSDTARQLLRVFFLQEALKKSGKKEHPKQVHVIGAGVMGADIAAWCVLQGSQVTLQDQSPALIAKAIKRTYDFISKTLKADFLIQAAMDRLTPDPQGEGIKRAEFIIEAITEKSEAKEALFKILETNAPPHTLLATNTSTIPLADIGKALKNPNRVVGIHFFNPVTKMPLVEVIQDENTEKEVIEKAIAFVRGIDKLPVQVKSVPGFLVNRILLPYLLEAMLLIEEGILKEIIDHAAVRFGMPMGPIELADTVGLDVCLAALQKLSLQENLLPARLVEMVAKGEYGRKTGKGFYEYKKHQLLRTKEVKEPIPPDITQRLILRLLNEAVASLREGIVDGQDKLDAACIFGFGFPPFRGGPLTYARSEGVSTLLALFKTFESRYGARFTPDPGWSLLE